MKGWCGGVAGKCPECGHEEKIFGGGGLDEEIERLETRLLADIPLDPDVRRGGDEGAPIVVSKPESHTTQAFLGLAETVAGLKPPHGSDDDDGGGDDGARGPAGLRGERLRHAGDGWAGTDGATP